MKKALILVLALILTAGCSRETEPKTYGHELTAEQKELLKSVSVSEENIDENNLYSWQVDLLEQYDFAMDYLHGKYPSHTFHITGCDWAKVSYSPTVFFFTAEDGGQYDLYVDTSGEEYSATDSFYGSLIEDEYGRLMEEYLKPLVPCLACRAYFSSAVGEDYDEGYTAQQVFDGDGYVENLVEIYLNSKPEAGLTETIENAIREKNLYGAYEIYFITDLPEGTDRISVFEYAKENQKNLTYKTFQNFQARMEGET